MWSTGCYEAQPAQPQPILVASIIPISIVWYDMMTWPTRTTTTHRPPHPTASTRSPTPLDRDTGHRPPGGVGRTGPTAERARTRTRPRGALIGPGHPHHGAPARLRPPAEHSSGKCGTEWTDDKGNAPNESMTKRTRFYTF